MKIISVVGARPNFMKVAALHKVFARYSDRVCHLICHTGQHYDEKMSKIFFDDLELPKPDFYLGVGGGSHAEQTAKIMVEFERVLLSVKPDLVIVVGDVNSTLAASVVASKLLIPVAHVEAGLRSFDRTMPEEINRIVTDVLSSYLFVTEESGMVNLKREGIGQKLLGKSQKLINQHLNVSTLQLFNKNNLGHSPKVYLVGDVMIDNLIHYLPKVAKSTSLKDFEVEPHTYILVTFHRPSNVDDEKKLKGLVDFLNLLSKKRKVIFPIHPRTRLNLEKFELKSILKKNVILSEPLGYIDFLALMKEAELVITDSGGMQEETTFLGVQCLTMRSNTERSVTLKRGTNRLAGTDMQKVEQMADEILKGEIKKGKLPELWDGRAAERIVQILLKEFGG